MAAGKQVSEYFNQSIGIHLPKGCCDDDTEYLVMCDISQTRPLSLKDCDNPALKDGIASWVDSTQKGFVTRWWP